MVTDRAQRYRANRVHKLKKRCEECRSREHLGVGHRDGNESNNRPSNLFTQCKSCNGKQTARDIKAGRGVRTRQYNPDKISGHEGWKQLMATKLAQKYDSLRKSGMSRDKALAETLRTTTAGPGSIALFRKIAKNPGANNLAQYVQAAVDHTRGAHDEGGRVIHETPKSKRREFAREIAFRKGHRNPARPFIDADGKVAYSGKRGKIPYRGFTIKPSGKLFRVFFPDGHEFTQRVLTEDAAYKIVDDYSPGGKWYRGNPRARRNPGESAADSLYRKFHGRGPDRIYEMQVAGIDPYGGHPELASLGPLIRFIVGEGVVLGGEYGDEVEECTGWVREISFVPSVPKWHQWLEDGERSMAEIRARLREYKTPDLAAVPNTKQLYILGGEYPANIGDIASDPEKDIWDLGSCYLVEYLAQKRFDRFAPIGYFHHFGEKSGVTPRLIFDRVHKVLSLAGGEYTVKPAGITN